MIVVSDSSVISNLLQVGHIDLLHKLFGQVIISPAVKRELLIIPEQGKFIDESVWISVKHPVDQTLIASLTDELDLGESESIVLALENKADYLLIDEYRGRTIAHNHGVKIVGILGILILAKKQKLIIALKPIINDLKEAGFRLSESLIATVLKQIDEA